MADTNDLVAFAQGANGDRANRGIEPRHIPAPGENTDQAFLGAHATAFSFSSSKQKENRRKRLDVQEASPRILLRTKPGVCPHLVGRIPQTLFQRVGGAV